jgi:hypothetical protein
MRETLSQKKKKDVRKEPVGLECSGFIKKEIRLRPGQSYFCAETGTLLKLLFLIEQINRIHCFSQPYKTKTQGNLFIVEVSET